MAWKINESVPKNFLDYQKKLKVSLEAKGIKQSFIYKNIGMSRSTWERRLKTATFTAHEILAVCKLINK